MKKDKNLLVIEKLIKGSKNVALFCHKNADLDCFGSCLAMKDYLLSINKKATVFVQENVAKRFMWLSGADEAKLPKDFKDEFDLFIALDCAKIECLGDYQETFSKAKYSINVDHHQDNTKFAKVNRVILNSANCINVYDMLKVFKYKMNINTATSLYAGIIGDTSNFTNLNTDAKTFEVSGELVKFGVDVNEANFQLFKRTTFNKFVFVNTLKSNIKLYKNIHVAVIKCSLKDFKKYKVTFEDIGAVIPVALSIDEVNICLTISERNDEIKCSFRSKKGININKVARAFGGGGHIYASACTCNDCSIDEFEKKIIKYIKTNYDSLKIEEKLF